MCNSHDQLGRRSNCKVEAVCSCNNQTKEMTCFLYAHHTTLALMRHHTKKRDIVRPGVTRFASAFLTLQSLDAKRKQLKEMCCSDTWEGCKHTRTKKGKVAHAVGHFRKMCLFALRYCLLNFKLCLCMLECMCIC